MKLKFDKYLFFSFLFTLSGIVCLYEAFAELKHIQAFMKNSVITTAVTASSWGCPEKLDTGPCLVIKFNTVNGEEIYAAADTLLIYGEGEKIKIVYQKDNPQKIKIMSFIEMYGQFVGLLGFGILLSGIGIWFIVINIRYLRANH